MSHLIKGDKVIIKGCMEEEANKGKVFTVSQDPWMYGPPQHRYELCMLDEYCGSFATEFLHRVVGDDKATNEKELQDLKDEAIKQHKIYEDSLDGYRQMHEEMKAEVELMKAFITSCVPTEKVVWRIDDKYKHFNSLQSAFVAFSEAFEAFEENQ